MQFSYDEWITAQSARLVAELRARALAGDIGGAVFVMPSRGAVPGALVLAHDTPAGAVDVVRFPGHGSRVASVPYSGLRSALWEACRRAPICPTE